jgi:hypothetical protein
MTMTPRITARARRLVAGALAAGAVAAVSACGGTSVLSLEVGQCISDQSAGEDEVSSVPVVDCAEPHYGEIYALPQLPDGEFPGDEVVSQRAQELCQGADFQTYVGVPYLESEIYQSALLPSAETWEEGDREIVCYLRNEDNSPITGSLRNANR